jgi:hypothetical protein
MRLQMVSKEAKPVLVGEPLGVAVTLMVGLLKGVLLLNL